MRTKAGKRICLAIDTTSPYLGLALHDLSSPGAPGLARHFAVPEDKQTDALFPTLDRLLKSKRLKRADLALIAVDHGPGSFTGVRVGVAAARAVAQALALPIVGVGSLEILAWEAAEKTPPGRLTIAARLPALAGDAYFAIFERGAKGQWSTRRAPVWTTEANVDAEIALLAKAGAHLVAVDRANATSSYPAGLIVHRAIAPDPSALARLACARCGPRPSAATFSIERTIPIYLQPSWAERSKKPARRGSA